MQIVILAAGRGERLRPLTNYTPKSLLQVANGLTLLESQLLSIQQVPEISETLLVVGYLAEQIEAKVQCYVRDGMSIRTIYNPFYDVSNNLFSLWFAMPYCGDEFVVVNGDDVFNPVVLSGLVASQSEREIVMVIDRKNKHDHEDMKVYTEGERAFEVSKKMSLDRANAESIGMIMFRGRGSHKLKAVLDQIVRQDRGKQVFWLAAVQQIIDEGLPVYIHECSPEDWAEIDFRPDLDTVQRKIRSDADALLHWIRRTKND